MTRLNPLDAGGSSPEAREVQLGSTLRAGQLRLLSSLAETTLGRDLRASEHTAMDAALTTALRRSNGRPTVPDVLEALGAPDRDAALADSSTVEGRTDDGRDLAHGLRRLVRGDLAGLFDGPSTVALDDDATMVVLDLSRLGSHDDRPRSP